MDRLTDGGITMQATRLFMLLAATAVATSSIAADSVSPILGATTIPAELHPAAKANSQSLGAKFSTSPLGLKPPSPRVIDGIDLPFGIKYSVDTKSLLVPIDPKSDWGIGLNLDVNAPRGVELAPPTTPLGLQPKRMPGLMLQKKF